MKLLGCFLIGFVSLPAHAMPGAFLASADDLTAIMYSSEVRDSLGGDVEISSVVREGGMNFVVNAAQCSLKVLVERYIDPNEPIPMVPKRRVKLGAKNCN